MSRRITVNIFSPAAYLRDGRLQRKFFAVQTQAAQRRQVIHRAVRHTRLSKLLNIFSMHNAIAIRDEAVDRLADRFSRAALEHFLGGGIE